jgi:dTDP-4-dehydrorhamnose 3,5-epimerase
VKISPLEVEGAFLIEVEPKADDRGFFARVFCTEEMGAFGMQTGLTQASISFNKTRGTLRGLHYQRAPHLEAKLVRCTRGGIFDVVVDVRKDSPTFRRWAGVDLTGDNRRSLYVPPGCAHGFQTLTDQAEVLYMMAGSQVPEAASGYRYDDPAFGIVWPAPPTVISERDLRYLPLDTP